MEPDKAKGKHHKQIEMRKKNQTIRLNCEAEFQRFSSGSIKQFARKLNK